MAERYWVGGTGNWNDATNHWAASDGGTPGAGNLPTSADNVHFTALSNPTAYTVTINATANCADMSWEANPATSGVPTLTGVQTLNIYGSLTMLSTMTRSFTGDIQFLATSGTKTITSAGKIWSSNFTFGNAGGTWQLQDTLEITTGSNNLSLVLSAGTFDANSKLVKLNVNAIHYVTVTGAFNFYNLTLNNTVGAGTGMGGMNLGSNMTVTNSFTVTTATPFARAIINASPVGTQRTLTAASVTLTDVCFHNIVGAGAASPFTGTRIGDLGHNSGITFTTGANKYAVGNASITMDSTDCWATSSGGSPSPNNNPLPQDTAVFNNDTWSDDTARTITFNLANPGSNLDFSSLTRLNKSIATSNGIYTCGSVTLSSSLAYNGSLTYLRINWNYSRDSNLLSAGKNIYVNDGSSPYGSLSLSDDLSCAGVYLVLTSTSSTAGRSFNTNNHNITTPSIYVQSGYTLNFGSSTITVNGDDNAGYSGTTFNLNASSVLNAGTSLIKFETTQPTPQVVSIVGINKNYYDVSFNGPSGKIFTCTMNASTFNNFTFAAAPITFKLTSSSSITANYYNVSGTAGNLNSLVSITAGTAMTLLSSKGWMSADYLSLQDCNAGPGRFFIGLNSTRVSNTKYWRQTSANYRTGIGNTTNSSA